MPRSIVPDGAVVRIGMQFMDAAASDLARIAESAEARRTAAWDAMIHRLDPNMPVKSDQFAACERQHSHAVIGDAGSAYEQYIADLQNGTYHKQGEQTDEP